MLYIKILCIYIKKQAQNYDLVESLDFGTDGNDKFLVISKYTVLVYTEYSNKFNI